MTFIKNAICLIFLIMHTFQQQNVANQQKNFPALTDSEHPINFKQTIMTHIQQIKEQDYSIVSTFIYPPKQIKSKFDRTLKPDQFVEKIQKQNQAANKEKEKEVEPSVNPTEDQKVKDQLIKNKEEIQSKQEKSKLQDNQQLSSQKPNSQQKQIEWSDIKVQQTDKSIKFKVHEMSTPSQLVTYDFEKPVKTYTPNTKKQDTSSKAITEQKPKDYNKQIRVDDPQPLIGSLSQKQKTPTKQQSNNPSDSSQSKHVSNHPSGFIDSEQRQIVQPTSIQEVVEYEHLMKQIGIGAAMLFFIVFTCWCTGQPKNRGRYTPLDLEQTSLSDER